MFSPAEILASLPEAERDRHAPAHLGGGSTGRALSEADSPPLPEARVLDLMRKQRRDMGVQQAFGNLINMMLLDGVPRERIKIRFRNLASDWAARYVEDQGEDVLSRKIADADERLSFFAKGRSRGITSGSSPPLYGRKEPDHDHQKNNPRPKAGVIMNRR